MADAEDEARQSRREEDMTIAEWMNSLPRGPSKHEVTSTHRPHRGSNPGRRSTDLHPGEVATRKVVILTVVLAQALYIAGDALLLSNHVC